MEIRATDWDRQFEVNVGALFSCCQQAAKQMIRQGGGAIVNIASNAGKVGYASMAAYNALCGLSGHSRIGGAGSF